MRCNNCGCQLDDNACICEKCGSFCGENMFVYSKKKYFKSELCSKKSKTLTTVAWVLVGLLAIVLINSIVTAAVKLPNIDKGESKTEILSAFEEAVGASTGITDELLEEVFGNDVEKCRAYFKKLAYTTVSVSAGIFVGIILLSVFTVRNKNSRCALWTLLLCFLSNLLGLVFGVAIFIISRIWDKEYNAYCINPSSADNSTNYNFS